MRGAGRDTLLMLFASICFCMLPIALLSTLGCTSEVSPGLLSPKHRGCLWMTDFRSGLLRRHPAFVQPLDPAWWEPWDVVEAEVFEDVRAEAWDIHQAERAAITLVDRISRGSRLLLVDDRRIDVDGIVARVHGAVVVVDRAREVVVMAGAIVEAEHLAPRLAGSLPAHATVGSWLRGHAGELVQIDIAGRPSMRGTLGVAAKDHVDVHGEDGSVRSVALGSVACIWLCAPVMPAQANPARGVTPRGRN